MQLAKYRFVSFPPSDVQRDRDQQIMTITARGMEAAQRLALQKWSTLKWLMDKAVTVLITAAIATLAAAWLVVEKMRDEKLVPSPRTEYAVKVNRLNGRLALVGLVAKEVLEGEAWAMKELVIGDPALISTDVGPVIDGNALGRLESHSRYLAEQGRRATLLYRCELPKSCDNGCFFPPHLYEINDMSVLSEEVFGPVVHVIRYEANESDEVLNQINATGYGLTLGVHSRNQTTAMRIAKLAQVGNVYINRNMIGAVVGVQPFGGRGLSGTGPKAGGPNYLPRLINHNPPHLAVPQVSLENNQGDFLSHGLNQGLLRQIQKAQSAWADNPFPVRHAGLKKLAGLVKDIGSGQHQQWLDELFEIALTNFDQALELIGPTGEDNHLQLESRGVTVVLFENLFIEGLKQTIAGLLAGNAIVMFVENPRQAEELAGMLLESGLPDHLITSQPWSEVRATLSQANINAVCLTNGSRFAKSVQKILAERPGPLIPLVMESNSHRLLMRLVVEKTISIDTTASGGNASSNHTMS
ncbi:MAG: aldehyde dehydrogenase family protein [Proteobacteria bacterium]|nr:aldehyde dehydrogenase family protein [Pseudomonadota bacterium]